MKADIRLKDLNKGGSLLSDTLLQELAAYGVITARKLAHLPGSFIRKYFASPNDALVLEAKNAALQWIAQQDALPQQPAIDHKEEQADPEPKIEELHLSVRSYNGLRRGGFRYISQVQDLSREDLLQLKYVGANSADEILLALQKYREKELIPQDDPDGLTGTCSDGKTTVSQSLSEIPISELNLSVRALHGLMGGGIATVGQLALLSAEELGKLKSIGKGTVCEILQELERFTASFRSDHSGTEPTTSEGSIPTKNLTDDLSFKLHEIWGRTVSYWKAVIERSADRDDREAILTAIHSDPQMYAAQEEAACRYLASQNDVCGISDLLEHLEADLVPHACAEDILARLSNAHKIRVDGETAVRIYPSVLEFADGLAKESQKLFLKKKLEGQTLEEIGSANGVTRERARQVIAKALEMRPKLKEDRYLPFFERYECTCEDFCFAFDEQPYVYYYLELAANRIKQRKPLTDAAEDDTLPKEMRRGIEKAAYKNYLYFDGVRVKKTRPELVQYYIHRYCRERRTYSSFEKGYAAFLEQEGLAEDTSLTLNSRTYENRLSEDNRSVLWSRGKQFRYYEIDEIDREAFLDALHLDSFRDVSISTLLLFRENPELMREYDIRDEYELHNLLRKLVGNKEGIIGFSKMPTVHFGKPDRASQILDLLLLHAPISANDLAAKYEEAYGFQAASALSNDFQAIDEYFHNGMYTIDSPALPPEQFERMKQDLNADYYTIDAIRDYYAETFPDAEMRFITPYTLKSLGFHVFDGYVIGNRFGSAIDYFRALLTKEDVIDLTDLPKSILDNGTFSALRYDMERSRELMEFAPNRLVSIHRLETAGFTKEDLRNYCDAVYQWVPPGTYVTPVSLRQTGFTHPLEDLGFDDWFYASLLWMDPRFRSQRIGGTRLCINADRQPSFNDLVLEILQRNGDRMDIYELKTYLEEQYGIVLDKDKIVFFIRKSDMYYDGIMEAAYTDYDTYYEEI